MQMPLRSALPGTSCSSARRFEGESTFRTGIELDAGELFLAVPRELSVANERALRRERRVSKLWSALPPVALGAYIRTLIMDEVVYSNEIEGVRSTRRDIERALEEARGSTMSAGGLGSHAPFFEFANLYLGLTKNPSFPMTLQDIRDIYDAVVMDALDESDRLGASLFRSGPVFVEDGHGKVIHTGVSPESKIEEMLRQWIVLSQREDIPEMYSAMLCHFLFGYIHPFYDGNGRTGRYLLALHLSKPLSQPTVLSLSRTIAENKAAYYRAFDTVERKLNCAEGTHFVMTMLSLVADAQERLIADLEEKQQMLDGLEKRIRAGVWSVSARAVETLLFAGQMDLFDAFRETRFDAVARWLDVSKPTARKAVNELADAGMLERISQRPPVFRLTDAGRLALGLKNR